MSRRAFVRTAAAMAIGFWAIDAVAGHVRQLRPRPQHRDDRRLRPRVGRQATGKSTLLNLPGEFIFDVQSHHVDPEGDCGG